VSTTTSIAQKLKALLVTSFRGLAKLWTALIILACLGSWAIVGGLVVLDRTVGIVPRSVATASMVPTYNVGDFVWYLQPTGADFEVGRTVAIAPDGDMAGLYTHRVVSVEPDGTATLKGDAHADGLVDVFHPTQADVAGVPFAVTKDDIVKWVLAQVMNDTVRYILTALGLGTFALWVIVNFGLNRRDDDRQNTFANRFNEMEAAMVERGFISDHASSGSSATAAADDVPIEPDPFTLFDSTAESSPTSKETQ
jgi:signal peptidase I